MSDVVDDVRRRMIEGLHKELLDGAEPLNIFRRSTIVDGLVICDASVDLFNIFYNGWRSDYETEEGRDRDSSFLDYVRRMHGAPVSTFFTWAHLTESPTASAYLCRKFATYGLPIDIAAQCLVAGKGDIQKTEDALVRILPRLDYKELIRDAPRHVARFLKGGRYADLDDSWRSTDARDPAE